MTVKEAKETRGKLTYLPPKQNPLSALCKACDDEFINTILSLHPCKCGEHNGVTMDTNGYKWRVVCSSCDNDTYLSSSYHEAAQTWNDWNV